MVDKVTQQAKNIRHKKGNLIDKSELSDIDKRHPTLKANEHNVTTIGSKPSWIRAKAPVSREYQKTKELVSQFNLNTVCQEASCPNIGECWSKKHVTVMIMGDICTRACRFCNVATGRPRLLDKDEPIRTAKALSGLGLNHVVITSVDRDDLPDGGALHFAQTIKEIRKLSPDTSIEVLTPDFLRKNGAEDMVIDAKPDVFNHNLETVPRLYPDVRPSARYFHSLQLLAKVKQKDPTIFTKSGIMVGLGETKSEVYQVMDDMRSAGVDFITIGQYLQPTIKHIPVDRFVTPEEFKEYERMARGKGFLMVASGPMVRSSYHADEDFAQLKQAVMEKFKK